MKHRIGLWSPIQSRSAAANKTPRKASMASKAYYASLSAADLKWIQARAAIRNLMQSKGQFTATAAKLAPNKSGAPIVHAGKGDPLGDYIAGHDNAAAAAKKAQTQRASGKKPGKPGFKRTSYAAKIQKHLGKVGTLKAATTAKGKPAVADAATGKILNKHQAQLHVEIARRQRKSNGKPRGGRGRKTGEQLEAALSTLDCRIVRPRVVTRPRVLNWPVSPRRAARRLCRSWPRCARPLRKKVLPSGLVPRLPRSWPSPVVPW